MKYLQFCLVCLMLLAQNLNAANVADAVKESGIRGGIVVHLNCGDGKDTASMLLNDRYLVHGLDTSAANIAKAKEFVRSKNLYGRVSVARYDGRKLPYGDSIVNLIVVDGKLSVDEAEMMRVLTPLGAMVVNGKKTVKPWPAELDDWPQYLHEADNNAVAMDTVVGPPRFLQWTDWPRWCRSHMSIPTIVNLVSGNGRLFTIEDTAPPDNPFLPSAFMLVARDAFNGKELWRRKITRWEAVTMYIKTQPLQQQRRMAVVGDTLYCTFDIEGPVTAVDAASGETIRVYKDFSPVQEVAYDDGILFLNVGDRFPTAGYDIVKTKNAPFVRGADPVGPFYGAGFRRGYAPEIKDKEEPVSSIVAVDPESGKELWAVPDIKKYTGGSLAIKGNYAVYQASDGLFCVESRTGRQVWSIDKTILNPVGHDSLTPGTTPNTVLIADDKVFAVESTDTEPITTRGGNILLHAYSLNDGKHLWETPVGGNYQASVDVFFVDGHLWVGGDNPRQLDPETGEEIRKIVQQRTRPMGHDRCYRNYISRKYFINSKTGGADFLELESGREYPTHWTRGGCGSGVLPANGLVYTTPYSCTCSLNEMLPGLNAYASVSESHISIGESVTIKRSVRLEKGPAYRQITDPVPIADDDWPVYRHDGTRSGINKAGVSGELSVCWKVQLPTRPSPVTVAAGKVFASDIETHTIFAIDSANGKERWTFTADARVDTPPTYYKGMVLFGSRGGWVYCLRASDGELAWRFKDLPDRLIGAYGQLESAWPFTGSVLVINDILYCLAGRNTFLDGGIVSYAMNPATGEVLKSRSFYGPFEEGTGFPAIKGQTGFNNDVIVTDGTYIYIRGTAFDLELADVIKPGTHVLASGGFTDGQPQHRTFWTLSKAWRNNKSIRGDIMVTDGTKYVEVQGFPVYHNHSYFDPRVSGYTLLAGSLPSATGAGGPTEAAGNKTAAGKSTMRRRSRSGMAPAKIWSLNIPITGKAIAMAGDTVFVAGEPMKFDDPSFENYVAAYAGEKGGRLLAVSATDGKQIAEYRLQAAPAWDGIAAANGKLYICLADGTIQCMGK